MTPHFLLHGYEAPSTILYNPTKQARYSKGKNDSLVDIERERIGKIKRIRNDMSTNYHEFHEQTNKSITQNNDHRQRTCEVRSCEAYLFIRRMKEARTVCAIQLARLEEKVVNIDPLSTIVYGKEGFVLYTCYDLMGNKKMNDIEMKGVTRIKAPDEQT